MKKIVLTFGSLSGLIPILMFVFSYQMMKNGNMQGSMILGYTTILISAAFIFVGIRSYRENYNEGIISFGKAFKVGILIALVSCLMYVIAWEILYYNFMPDFMERYAEITMKQLKDSGATQLQLDEAMKQNLMYKSWYSNPFSIAALTFLEPFPISLAVTLISSLILKRKTKKEAAI
jgi:hypothetical protein